MSHALLSAFLLGLVGGSIPGPVLACVFTEILQFGLFRSFRIILWAMITETIFALLNLWIFSSMHFSESFFKGLSFVGAIILIWISISIWKIRNLNTEENIHFSLWQISAMILANGVFWTFWITVCIPQAILLNEQMAFGSYLFLLLIEIGWFFATACIAFIFSRFRTTLSHPKVVPIIFKIFALTFIYFALTMIYDSVRYFLI